MPELPVTQQTLDIQRQSGDKQCRERTHHEQRVAAAGDQPAAVAQRRAPAADRRRELERFAFSGIHAETHRSWWLSTLTLSVAGTR